MDEFAIYGLSALGCLIVCWVLYVRETNKIIKDQEFIIEKQKKIIEKFKNYVKNNEEILKLKNTQISMLKEKIEDPEKERR